MSDEHDRLRSQLNDRREIACRIDDLHAVQRRIDRDAGADDPQRVAIGRCAHRERRSDVAAGAGTILDDDRLAE